MLDINQNQIVHKTPPLNYEAEQALLGALLHNNASLERVSEFLRPEHFADPNNGKIYKAICTLLERNQVADPITLNDYFAKDKTLAEIGGVEYLVTLADAVVSIVNVQHYGELIYDLHIRRELINLGEGIVTQAHTPTLESSATQQIEQAEKLLFDLGTTGQSNKGFQSFDSSLTQAIKMAEVAYKRDSHIVGITTGLNDLDKWLGGLHPSDLIIIAARPSMGKTALATNIAFNAALAKITQKEGGHVGFFSLEMSSEQLATRLLAQESAISSDRIRRGELRSEDFPKFVEVSRRISQIPLYIDDTPALSISALRTRARRLKRQHGLDLIVIDYLQLLNNGGSESRVQEISEITRGLKALAKELNIPIIALSQLSRAVEQRDDKRPQLADLRESGTIEQDADVVMFIYREEYYEARREPEAGTSQHIEWQEKMSRIYNQADILIAKQRHGPVGHIKLFFDGKLTKFGDLARE